MSAKCPSSAVGKRGDASNDSSHAVGKRGDAFNAPSHAVVTGACTANAPSHAGVTRARTSNTPSHAGGKRDDAFDPLHEGKCSYAGARDRQSMHVPITDFTGTEGFELLRRLGEGGHGRRLRGRGPPTSRIESLPPRCSKS